jgi:hypothetical protein
MDGGEETGARVRQVAGDVLGLADLRPAQMEAAAALAAGRHCLAVPQSGAGKSAIYQIAGGLLTAGDHSDGCQGDDRRLGKSEVGKLIALNPVSRSRVSTWSSNSWQPPARGRLSTS